MKLASTASVIAIAAAALAATVPWAGESTGGLALGARCPPPSPRPR